MGRLHISFKRLVLFLEIVLSPTFQAFHENDLFYWVPALIPTHEPFSFEAPNANINVAPMSENVNSAQADLQTAPTPKLSPLVITPHHQRTSSELLSQLRSYPMLSPPVMGIYPHGFVNLGPHQTQESRLDFAIKKHQALSHDHDQVPSQIDPESSSKTGPPVNHDRKLEQEIRLNSGNCWPERHGTRFQDHTPSLGDLNYRINSEAFDQQNKATLQERRGQKRPLTRLPQTSAHKNHKIVPLDPLRYESCKGTCEKIEIPSKESIYAQIAVFSRFPKFLIAKDDKILSIDDFVLIHCKELLARFRGYRPTPFQLSPRLKKLHDLLVHIGKLHCCVVELFAPQTNTMSKVVKEETEAFFAFLNEKILNQEFIQDFLTQGSTLSVDQFHKSIISYLDYKDNSEVRQILLPGGKSGTVIVAYGKLRATTIAGNFLEDYLKLNEQKFNALFPSDNYFVLFLQKLGHKIRKNSFRDWRENVASRPLHFGPLPWGNTFNLSMMNKEKGRWDFQKLLTYLKENTK
ncbi:hypothetical protein O181_071757 [Austropuccinia psidii MF-1]|uniref:Uncharacterized protein n=1 Tax=Austropuccinia psidii MF-1 TaxID=1389203 RepID=A0A9Q3F5S1_9BASI|nr:hypothetical protein [Austropuccinia psidii MF-1]